MADVPTYCRICEPLCGLIATVEDGRLVSVRGDRDNPLSQGFHCVKSNAMIDVVYDPDRLLRPQRRTGAPGQFEPVDWDIALSDTAGRLRRIVADHGPEAVAFHVGNPPYFSFSAPLALEGLQRALGTPYRYGVNAEDFATRMVANRLLYGNPALFLKPDLWHTDFALVVGANPLVSHGSGVTEPRFSDALKGIVDRGGRVVVVDPRRSETARHFEHIPIRAGTDGWLLAALVRELLRLPTRNEPWLARFVTGVEALRVAVEPFSPEAAEPVTGIPAETTRRLARDFHASPSATVYGRTGSCTQQYGTVVNVLLDALCWVTANVDRAGGLLWPWGPIDFARLAQLTGLATYGKVHSVARGYPDVAGQLPSRALAQDILTDGPNRIRAVVMIGANPVITSGGGGPPLEEALERLDLFVSLDPYVTETSKHAHYVFPTSTWFEREDLPLTYLGLMLRPTIMATPAVIDRIGDTRDEWDILDELARRMGLGGAYPLAAQRFLARFGIRPGPRTMIDAAIRLTPIGDLFGLRRSGTSWAKLLRLHPHGKALRDDLPTGRLRRRFRTRSVRVDLAPAPIVAELERLAHDAPDADEPYPLRAHGLREARSHNSWLHNAARLMPAGRSYAALVNPTDGEAAGLEDGGPARITSESGTLTVTVRFNNDVSPGNVALPHGWGHAGGWQRANAAGGANSNILVSSEVERLAAMSVLSGIPVRLEPVSEEVP